MKKLFMGKWIAGALALSMVFGTAVYAGEETYEPVFFEETAVSENTKESGPEEILEEETLLQDAENPEDLIIPESSAIEDDAIPVPCVDEESCLEAIEEVLSLDELVGNKLYTLKLDTPQDFTCTGGKDLQVFAYKAAETGSYRFDVTETKEKMQFALYTQKEGELQKITDWKGLYIYNDITLVARLEKGQNYYFAIIPDSERSESGTVNLSKVTNAIESVTVTADPSMYLRVGFGGGSWAQDADGNKDYNVWKFGLKEILTLYTAEITFTDNTTMTWKGTDGFEIGSTGLIVIPEQITTDWKLNQKAYCNLYFGNIVKKMEISYKELFTDVKDPSHAYYKAICWAADYEITKGYSDGSFGIDRACTRSEAVMFLWRLAGKPAPESASKSPFSDVSTKHAHYKAILWASQKGITKGFSDGTFKPNDVCTRGQIMTFIWRVMGSPAPTSVAKSPFTDVQKTHAYYKAILWGSQKGITKGFKDGTFGINKDCTRGQIVTFLYRI